MRGSAGQTFKEAILAAWKENPLVTVQLLSDRFGVSREMVRQVLEDAGIDGRARVSARAAARRVGVARAAARLIGSSGSAAAVAEKLGVSPAYVRESLGEHRPAWRDALRARPKQALARFPNDVILANLRAAAATLNGKAPSVNDYQRLRAEEHHDWPTAVVVTLRLGSWNEALTCAGLEPRPRPRSSFGERRFSDEQLIGALRSSVGNDGKPPSVAGYIEWHRNHPGTPSSSTIRNRFGSWSAALNAAFPHLRAVLA